MAPLQQLLHFNLSVASQAKYFDESCIDTEVRSKQSLVDQSSYWDWSVESLESSVSDASSAASASTSVSCNVESNYWDEDVAPAVTVSRNIVVVKLSSQEKQCYWDEKVQNRSDMISSSYFYGM
jgi:hypothetical protein